MLKDVAGKGAEVGLNVHPKKTKILRNKYAAEHVIKLEGKTVEDVRSCVYLGQNFTWDHDQTAELRRRIGLGWAAFNKLKEIMTCRKTSMILKRKAYIECILPTMIYGSETWSLSETKLKELTIAQRKMERMMLGVTLRDKMKTEDIRRKTQVKDIIRAVKEAKHRWAGQIASRTDNRWTLRVSEWYPRGCKRPRARPCTRWSEPLRKMFGAAWSKLAKDEKAWKISREGFLQ